MKQIAREFAAEARVTSKKEVQRLQKLLSTPDILFYWDGKFKTYVLHAETDAGEKWMRKMNRGLRVGKKILAKSVMPGWRDAALNEGLTVCTQD